MGGSTKRKEDCVRITKRELYELVLVAGMMPAGSDGVWVRQWGAQTIEAAEMMADAMLSRQEDSADAACPDGNTGHVGKH